MTQKEVKKIKEHELKLNALSDKYKKLKARCNQYCSVWNSEDKDCEIYGSQHPSPSRCLIFLERELSSQPKE